MAIPLNATFVKSLVDARFGSIDNLVVEWEERVALGQQKAGGSRDRATIYRWLKRGIPSRQDELYGFCATLDVDPIAVLSLSKSFIDRVFSRERLLLQLNAIHRSQFAPLWLIYRPGPGWPNVEISRSYYNRPWNTAEFSHDAKAVTGVYATVRMTAPPEGLLPQAYHFAYRRTNTRDGMWRPYGTVMRFAQKTVLISESGDYQEDKIRRPTRTTVANTYFGDGPAEFKLASLHPFDLDVDPFADGDGIVRFLA